MFNSRLIITCQEADPSFVVGEWPFICAFSYCNNYETNSDKNQKPNSSSGIVIRPPAICRIYCLVIPSPQDGLSPLHSFFKSVNLLIIIIIYIIIKISQFHEWFCVAMLTEQALASKKMISLKKYLMKNAKNKVSNFSQFSVGHSPYPLFHTLAQCKN